MVDTIYFGKPGAQITLPAVLGGIASPRSRQSQTFATGSGSARVSHSIDGRRKFTLAWDQLFRSDYNTIEAYWHGHNGSGPWSFIDPSRLNLLTPNQSGATSLRNDTLGFTVTGGAVIGSASDTVLRGPRSLSVDQSASISLDSPAPVWPGIPVIQGVAYCFSFYLRTMLNAFAQLAWLDNSGVTLSYTYGANANGILDWTQVYAAGIPPAGAAFVRPQLESTGSGRLDKFQLEIGSTPTTWQPGTGCYPVAIESLGDGWPWNASEYVKSPTMILQEVG